MAFEEILPQSGNVGKMHTGASAFLLKMRSAPAKLRLALKPETMGAMGFGTDHAFTALLGTGDDHGCVRLAKNDAGAFRLASRSAGRGEWYEVSLGHQPAFVDRREKAVPCRWERIDENTIEIVLPAWADETRPKGARVLTALPPHVAAAKREAERRETEEQESAARRGERDKADEDVAWSEFKRRLDETPRAGFDLRLKLTRSEKGLLTILSDRAGKLVSRDTLMQLLYADRPDAAPRDKIVDVWVCKLRPKIEPRGCSIENVHGEGYVFRGDAAALMAAP